MTPEQKGMRLADMICMRFVDGIIDFTHLAERCTTPTEELQAFYKKHENRIKRAVAAMYDAIQDAVDEIMTDET